jgi:hypothetical protein
MDQGRKASGTSAVPEINLGYQPGWSVKRLGSDLRDIWDIRKDSTYREMAKSYEFPDGSKRVYCYHIRKTAGTSLTQSFMSLAGEDPMEVWRRTTTSRLPRAISGPYVFAANRRRLLTEGAYFYGRSHSPADDQPLPPKTFTVTILRDPIARIHSYFDFLVAGDDPDLPVRVAEQVRRRAQDGLEAMLDRMPTEHLLNQLCMFSTRYDISEAEDRISQCSSVFFTEDFAGGLAALGRRLDLPLEVRFTRVNKQRSTLSDQQIERLRTVLEPEYELLRRLSASGVASMGSLHSA